MCKECAEDFLFLSSDSKMFIHHEELEKNIIYNKREPLTKTHNDFACKDDYLACKKE